VTCSGTVAVELTASIAMRAPVEPQAKGVRLIPA
jgi:hypothetical protein